MLNIEMISAFIWRLGKQLSRVGVQKPVAALRNYLRYLTSAQVFALRRNRQIDTPLVERLKSFQHIRNLTK
jgi:hypothetical protein